MVRKKEKLIGNWKMHPKSLDEAKDLAKEIEDGISSISGVDVGLSPPFPFLVPIEKILHKVSLGAQDAFWKSQGSFTGEVSHDQLKDLGVSFVIEGHSERRRVLNEDDELISKEVEAGLKSGLDVILCVGEDAKKRDEGVGTAKDFVKDQLSKDLSRVEDIRFGEVGLYVAYEPIWAISSNEDSKPASAGQVEEMTSFIHDFVVNDLGVPLSGILYGGSTDSSNVVDFVSQDSVDGALVGSSSLDSGEFIKMAKKISESAQ